MRVKFAIISPNALQSMGMKRLLQFLVPAAEVCLFYNAEELAAQVSHRFIHYFVSADVITSRPAMFEEIAHKTVVLTSGNDNNKSIPPVFHTINVDVPANILIKEMTTLMQRGHAPMVGTQSSLPATMKTGSETITKPLTRREAEVLKQVAIGRSSKEIADSLGISPSTVISHRKSIMEKLNAHSATKLVMFAVTHGWVRTEDII